MILVDSSVWIDFFNGVDCRETDELDSRLAGELILTGDIILAEVLQGFRRDSDFHRARELLARLECRDMLGREVALFAADNYRKLRKMGVTARKTIDVMIGSFCIQHGYPLLYTDRDFDPMVAHLGLESA